MSSIPEVILREVGLRDGLQSHPRFIPTEFKLDWVRREAAAGISDIEVTSYVPPKLIPQFADAEFVTVEARKIPGLTVAALIPNRRGAERGIELGVHKLNFVMSASRTHSAKNVRRTPEESLADFAAIVQMARDAGPNRPLVIGGVATAFGCSYEGAIDPDEVIRLAVAQAESGADQMTVADTVGYANPAQVRTLFRRLKSELGELPLAAHFHDTRGTGLANVFAALDAGVTAFDASLAGLGGCPFAPGASGNVVMEDLAFMLDSMGVKTNVDVPALIALRNDVAAGLSDMLTTGALARAGLPTGYRQLHHSLAVPA